MIPPGPGAGSAACQRRRMLVLAFASCLAAAASTGAQPNLDPAGPFLPFWDRLPDHAGWRMLVSAPFPQSWPPGPGRLGAVVRYAFAMRLRPGLADGVEVAAPWARSTLRADGTVTVEPLRTRLEPLGVQGVRPLTAAESALAGQEGEVARLLLAGGQGAEAGLVRDYTCGWIGRLGIVAAAITPLHPAFSRWLACP